MWDLHRAYTRFEKRVELLRPASQRDQMRHEINTPMQLVMFDVDGTLVDGTIDTKCFLQAFRDVCGFTEVDAEWAHYTNATDAGVYSEVFEFHHGRMPSLHETTMFREHLFKLFREAARQSPFPPIPGAAEMLAMLNRCDEYRVTIATGCWRESARIKMASAGMDYGAYPSASADDAFERATIIQLAMQRAVNRYGVFHRNLYVGDGVWDARACCALGIPFVGIGTGDQAKKLRSEGAVHVFADLADANGFLAVLKSIGNCSRQSVED